MPNSIHEALHHALRGDPGLIGTALYHATGVALKVRAAEEITNDATSIRVTERRCDTVMRLEVEGHGTAVLLVESQTRKDPDKGTVWPQIVAHFQDKYDCPVILVVITQHERTAEWARGPFARSFAGLRAGLALFPSVVSPSTVPLITDPTRHAPTSPAWSCPPSSTARPGTPLAYWKR